MCQKNRKKMYHSLTCVFKNREHHYYNVQIYICKLLLYIFAPRAEKKGQKIQIMRSNRSCMQQWIPRFEERPFRSRKIYFSTPPCNATSFHKDDLTRQVPSRDLDFLPLFCGSKKGLFRTHKKAAPNRGLVSGIRWGRADANDFFPLCKFDKHTEKRATKKIVTKIWKRSPPQPPFLTSPINFLITLPVNAVNFTKTST